MGSGGSICSPLTRLLLRIRNWLPEVSGGWGLRGGANLTLLHSELPKLYRVGVRVKEELLPGGTNLCVKSSPNMGKNSIE